MPPIYVKPENALKRSEELLALGTTQSQQQAFENLWEVFQSKRFKHTDIKILEPIMFKFIDLCVQLTRKSYARLSLLTYKNAAQGSNVGSIENVLNHFIAAAEGRLTSATEQAKQEVAALPDSPVVDDELPLQPSAMLLDSFIDKAGDRERIERRLIGPAQKFCWDAYDISLDVAKGNDRLELIYQSIAHRAFKFCKDHERKSDFRRLCEQRLRKDIQNAAKYGHQQHAINLSDPDTLNRHLDTRFLQLETAIQLELWQEAFRSVEDVHHLLSSKKAKPAMMANFYEKLTQIFKAEGGKATAIFHAAAWANFYHFAERAGTITVKAPGCVLLSALSVPLGDIETKDALIDLLNLNRTPTRQDLVRDAAGRHIKRVPAEIRSLYNIIELEFQPLTVAKRLAPLVSALTADYQPYLPALRDVVLSRLLQELSQLYDSISLSHILELVKPFDGTSWAIDLPSLEKFIMTSCREGNLAVRINHVAKSITFTGDTTDMHRLSNLALCLYNTVQYLNPTPVTSRADAFAAAIAQAEEERKNIAHRRQIVTKRRELLEEANLRREREESTAKAEQAKALADENARLQKEAAAAADRSRIQKQIDATRREEAEKLAQTLAAKGDLKVDISTIEDLDSSKLVDLQVKQLAKEKKELNDRLRIVSKRVDHLERAFRKEERPLLAEDYERQKKDDKEAHDKANVLAREQAIEQQKASIELKKRLGRMLPDYLVARQVVESQQEQDFQAARADAAKKIEAEKAKFKESVLARRKAERKQRDQERAAQEEEERQEREREEEEARQADERDAEEAKARAEVEKRQAEAAERATAAKAEREAQRAKDEELLRLRLQREEEAEQRQRERSSGTGFRRNDSPATGSPSQAPPAAGPPKIGGAGGGWRERLAQRQAGGESPASTPSPPPPEAAVNGDGEAAPERGGVYRRGMGMRGRGGGATPPSTRGGAGGASGGSRW